MSMGFGEPHFDRLRFRPAGNGPWMRCKLWSIRSEGEGEGEAIGPLEPGVDYEWRCLYDGEVIEAHDWGHYPMQKPWIQGKPSEDEIVRIGRSGSIVGVRRQLLPLRVDRYGDIATVEALYGVPDVRILARVDESAQPDLRTMNDISRGAKEPIIFTCPGALSEQAKARLREQVEGLWPGRKCVVLEGGAQITTVSAMERGAPPVARPVVPEPPPLDPEIVREGDYSDIAEDTDEAWGSSGTILAIGLQQATEVTRRLRAEIERQEARRQLAKQPPFLRGCRMEIDNKGRLQWRLGCWARFGAAVRRAAAQCAWPVVCFLVIVAAVVGGVILTVATMPK